MFEVGEVVLYKGSLVDYHGAYTVVGLPALFHTRGYSLASLRDGDIVLWNVHEASIILAF